YSPVNKVHDALDYPISDGQRRLWVLSQMEEGSRAYHLYGQIDLQGHYQAEYLEASIGSVISRHEILRTVFRQNEEGDIRQEVLPAELSVFRMYYQDMKD